MFAFPFLISVIIFNLFAYILIKFRAKIYKNEVFKPMLWNMKLSIMPVIVIFSGVLLFLIIMYLSTNSGLEWLRFIGVGVIFITLLIWILLLPNAAYLMTELNLTHRNMDQYEVPIWYDIISVLTLSLSGILNTILGIISIQLMWLIMFDPPTLSTKNNALLFILALIIIILVSIGVYLGREIRFNSWDILHPIKFIKRLYNHLRKPNELLNCFLFITLHSLFLLLMYLMLAPRIL